MAEGHQHPPEHVFERYLAGFLDDQEVTDLEGAVSNCPQCQARLAETRSRAEAFLLKNVPAAKARAVFKQRGRPRWQHLFAGATAAAAMAAALVLFVQPEQPTTLPKGTTPAFYLTTEDGEHGVEESIEVAGAVQLRIKPFVESWQVIGCDSRSGVQTLASSASWTSPQDPVVEIGLDGDRGAVILVANNSDKDLARLAHLFRERQPSQLEIRRFFNPSPVRVIFLQKMVPQPHKSKSSDVGEMEPQNRRSFP